MRLGVYGRCRLLWFLGFQIILAVRVEVLDTELASGVEIPFV
jgi:hypothetical protein